MARLFCLIVCLFVLSLATTGSACPFCTAEQSTLTEELANSDAAVIARLVQPAPPLEEAPDDPQDPDAGKAEFQIVEPLFGPANLTAGSTIKALYFGDPDKESLYLVRGLGEPADWAIPLKLSAVAVDYVKRLRQLPDSGPERVAFFKDYLQHADPMLAQDAYDEFARAPYEDLRGIADRIDRPQLLEWIQDPSVSPSRRRLFFTMLGVCGQAEDLPQLEAMLLSDSRRLLPTAQVLAVGMIAGGGPMTSAIMPEAYELNERRRKLGLDAMIACYLTLKGPEGLDLIDQRFLAPVEVAGKLPDYSHIYAALMALRFLAEETELIPMPRVLASARLLLDNPDFADQVIPDLARWEDWSVLERLTEMYRQAGEPGSGIQKYVREPIITYLDVAAESEGDLRRRANDSLADIEPIDPDAVRRSRSLRAFGFLGRAQTATLPTGSGSPRLSEEAPDAAAPLEEPPVQENADITPVEDELPDPASFAIGQQSDPTQATVDEASDPAELAPATDAAEESAAFPQAPPIRPPSQTLLVAAPLLAGIVCFGVFWAILRPGGT